MPEFSDADRALIRDLTDQCVTMLELGKEWTFKLPKPGWFGGEPWTLVVNLDGAGIVRGEKRKFIRWPDIESVGVNNVAPGYIYIYGGGVGRGGFILRGTKWNDQVLMVVLQNVHERMSGRYIYPRLKPKPSSSSAHKVVTAIAGEWDPRQWDSTSIPAGKPPPIIPLSQLSLVERTRRLSAIGQATLRGTESTEGSAADRQSVLAALRFLEQEIGTGGKQSGVPVTVRFVAPEPRTVGYGWKLRLEVCFEDNALGQFAVLDEFSEERQTSLTRDWAQLVVADVARSVEQGLYRIEFDGSGRARLAYLLFSSGPLSGGVAARVWAPE